MTSFLFVCRSCWHRSCGAVLVAVSLAGCGTSAEPKKTPGAAPAATNSGKGADSATGDKKPVATASSDPILPPPAPGETSKAHPLTKPNLDRVQIGMGEKEVAAILGPPSSQEKSPDDETVAYHNWNVDEIYVDVRFRNGKVERKGGSGLLPSVLPRLTRANFDKIEIGMGEKDLYALLGHPTSTDLNSDELKLKWEDIAHVEKNIEVDVVAGKVTSKTSQGLE
jgi:hypothetical protein